MYHDAPVEAAVTVHRRRHRPSAAATPHEASHRIVHEYQLHRVANFLLTGQDGKGSFALCNTPSAQQSAKPAAAGEAPVTTAINSGQLSCPQCRPSRPTPESVAPYVRVALQFPDELLNDSVAVVSALQDILTSDPRYSAAMQGKMEAEGVRAGSGSSNGHSSAAGAATPATAPRPAAAATGAAVSARPPAMDNPHRPVGQVRLFVLADNTFGSCCPDEITAQHYMADCIVHFGNACMSRSTRLPVLYIQPAFHFDTLLSDRLRDADHLASPAQAAAVAAAESGVIISVVRRVAVTLRRRVAAWRAKQGGATASAESCLIVPRLTIVGTYPTAHVMQAAEQCWKDKSRRAGLMDSVVVEVDWPRYEERNSVVPALCDCQSSCAADVPSTVVRGGDASALPSNATPVVEEDWIVNGVRFPRLRSGGNTAREEVQYLLFIGAAGSAALVHVLTAEQYNAFHYSAACREFLEWDSGDEETTLPTVMVLNNTFGLDAESGESDAAALQGIIEASTGDESCTEKLQERVACWISAVLADGVTGLITGDYIVAQQALQRRTRQRAFNIESVRASTAIGILVCSLAVEGYYELTQQLHQLIRAYGKRSYVIYVGHLNEFKLANFVDTVDCFVAVACPYSRQSHFPEKRDNFMKPIVSPAELLVALTTPDDTAADAQYGMAAVYTTSFETSLRVLRGAVQARKDEIASRTAGDAASNERRKKEEEQWASSGALVRPGVGGGGGALTLQGSSQGALERLYEREFVGLDPRIGQTPVQTEVAEGKHGIARGYTKEREEQHAELPESHYK
jgi:diphthamide synthase subunit DPH2